MPFKLPRSSARTGDQAAEPSPRRRVWPGRLWLARLAAIVCVAGLVLTFAWPVADAQQDEQAPGLGGIYTVTIGRVDIPTSLPGGPTLIGQWIVTFNPDGTYTVARQDVGVVASGTYEINGATLKFVDWLGLVGCAAATEQTETGEADAVATYAWRIEDEALVLTPIHESCTDRKLLFTTRSFVAYEPCVTVPFGAPPGAVQAEASAAPAAAATPSVAQQEGEPRPATIEDAIDELLRQATGCWATGDPARFLPLHSEKALADITFNFGPLPDFVRNLRLFMSTPVQFERIGDVNVEDATHAWAYVEITFGGEPIPQRQDFVLENGNWLLDNFFLLGPPVESQPAGPGGPPYAEPTGSSAATTEPEPTEAAEPTPEAATSDAAA